MRVNVEEVKMRASMESEVSRQKWRCAQHGTRVDVDHTWPWALNSHHGPTPEPEEFVDSVRLRLGCMGPIEPVACAACQSGLLDSGAAHAACCVLEEATRGHNAVTALVDAAA